MIAHSLSFLKTLSAKFRVAERSALSSCKWSLANTIQASPDKKTGGEITSLGAGASNTKVEKPVVDCVSVCIRLCRCSKERKQWIRVLAMHILSDFNLDSHANLYIKYLCQQVLHPSWSMCCQCVDPGNDALRPSGRIAPKSTDSSPPCWELLISKRAEIETGHAPD